MTPPGSASLLQPPKVAPLPDIQPIETVPFKWAVVTDANGKAWFALDDKGYQALALTLQDTTRWVREASFRLQECRRGSQP